MNNRTRLLTRQQIKKWAREWREDRKRERLYSMQCAIDALEQYERK